LNPQICKNFIVNNKKAGVQDTALTEQINNINKNLSDGGRVILRASGTENLIRVMVETKSEEKCVSLIKQIEQLMKERNYLL
jgi:phosphoglucosamine mutase